MGFSGLQKNFFMERLAKMAATLNRKTHHPCEACLENNDPISATKMPAAVMYCTECRQKLCGDCCELHKKNKLLKTHRLLALGGDGLAAQDIGPLETFAQKLCDVHEKNYLDSYCKDCNEVVCAWCFIENHQNHSWSSVDKILDDFHEQVGQNLSKLSGCLRDILRRRQELDNDSTIFLQTVQNLELTIIQTRDEIKRRVDEDANSLLVELSFTKQRRLKAIENAVNGVEHQLVIFESFVRYCDEMKSKGTASDICLAFNDLDKRADELSAMHCSLMQLQNPALDISFKKSSFNEILLTKDQNLIGEFCVDVVDDGSGDAISDEQLTSSSGDSVQVSVSKQEMLPVEPETVTSETQSADAECINYRRTPFLIKTIKTSMSHMKDKPIWGVAILDRELFILTQKMSKIDVFCTEDFRFKRRISATMDFVNPRDIVSCNRNRCLYVIDWKEKCTQKEIVRLEPSGTVIQKWLTGEDKGLLSISRDANVILTVTTKNMLKEYSPEGQLIREVILSPDGSSPWHAVKLTNGHFVVSKDDDRLHTVSIVDGDGRTVRSFIRDGDTNLKGSVHVVVDEGGTVLLADTFKNRVLLLSSDLHYKRLLVSKSHGLRCPVRMQLEESSGRLFIVDNEYDYFSRGKWRDGRILVFDVTSKA